VWAGRGRNRRRFTLQVIAPRKTHAAPKVKNQSPSRSLARPRNRIGRAAICERAVLFLADSRAVHAAMSTTAFRNS
jgi:hypothetical protein